MVSQMTAAELVERVDGGDGSFTLVDTRQEDSFEGWHAPGAENLPFDPTEGFEEGDRRRVEEESGGDPVVVVCGKGLTSTPFGIHLEDSGYDDVTVVRGGMRATSTVHESVEIDDGGGTPGNEDPNLVVRQLQRRATGCLGYVIGSRSSGEAVVVDPTRQTDEFAAAAARADLTVTAVVDTHLHADHVSGGPSLAAELGVPYYLGADVNDRGSDRDAGGPEIQRDHESLADGGTIDLGGVEVRAVHAPGHTEEMVNLVVDDRYLLSGDTLFLDSVGRTELGFGEDDAERGAELLHESLQELLALDDDVAVLPGHVTLSDDLRYESATPGEPVRARIGDLQDDLDLLALDRESFTRELTEDLPEKPSDYEAVVAVNAGRETVDTEEEAADLETGPNDCAA